MKPNSGNCTIGVESGKLLDFMITQRGSEANPNKIRAILDLKHPKMPKEVQRLTGQLTCCFGLLPRQGG